MGGLEDKPLRKCEQVYTTLRGRVAMQTLQTRRVSGLQRLSSLPVGPGIATPPYGVLLKAITSFAVAGVSLLPSERTAETPRPGAGGTTALSASPITTIFTTPPRSRAQPSVFMVSVLMHSVVVMGALTLRSTPRVEEQPLPRRYTTLIVKLQRDEPRLQWSPGSSTAQPTPQAETHEDRSSEPLAVAAAPPSPTYRVAAPITLVQPDIRPNTLLPLKTPLPLVMMWTPPEIPVKTIVPPLPQAEAATNVRPSLSMPNHELLVANVALASTPVLAETLPLVAGTTSLLMGPRQAPSQIPESTSTPPAQPTRATVLSVSDVLLANGAVVLPSANQAAAASSADAFAPGRPEGTSATGDGTVVGQRNESESGVSSDEPSRQKETATGPGRENGAPAGSNSGSDTNPDPGLAFSNGSSVHRITRPKDGHFGVVVVGDSAAEEYPEAAGIWADRFAYTVYIHVGEAKSWILQYCLPRTAQAAGNTLRPDAPWPYLIVTPHLSPGDFDTDALLVHGFIDAAGHFEQLAVVFPTQFAQSKFVLDALQQWQFRPATQNGQSVAVEVLLIIPQDTD